VTPIYQFTNLTLDVTFNPGVSGGVGDSQVTTIAVQADGKILAGGIFATLGGQSRTNIGRLNANGTVDSTFNPGASSSYFFAWVKSLAMQADGKILVGGDFDILCGQSRTNIGRLNADGTLDRTFNPGADVRVYSLAVQADGKILVGGWFYTLGGQSRNNIGRLNSDGSVDLAFNPGANSDVNCLAVQPDGRILAGGKFNNLGGQYRSSLGRLYNTELASQDLTFDASKITWLRGGTAPEVWRTTFESSSNGTNWVSLGAGTRISGGWQLTGLSLPANTTIRARGFVVGNGLSWFVESLSPQVAPAILVNDGRFGVRSNQFGFNLVGSGGSVVVVECSTNLLNWIPLGTNMLPSGPIYFSDPGSTNFPRRFYRARLQ
jgi:uncharacterized delta-60 repeat protein